MQDARELWDGLGRPLDVAICDLLLGHILAHAEEPDANELLDKAASEFERLGVDQRLHELADRAYFKRVLLVASAHNMPVESFPWRFASVISVGSHEETDPLTFYYNPTPPVKPTAKKASGCLGVLVGLVALTPALCLLVLTALH